MASRNKIEYGGKNTRAQTNSLQRPGITLKVPATSSGKLYELTPESEKTTGNGTFSRRALGGSPEALLKRCQERFH
eukprot:6386077-Pyramimonas_sp.AAC.1